MATTPIGADSVPVTLPGSIPPAPAVMAILDRFNRAELGNTIEVLVALLDVWDGDEDLEEDDPSGQCDEDGINTDITWRGGAGPGCTISDMGEEDDPAGCEHDGREPEEDI